MRFHVILNRDGGSLRTIDLGSFARRISDILSTAGHEVDVAVVSGRELAEALEAATVAECDVVIVGGGDGTISTAATKLRGTDKALAVLPAGTMNLFARSLAIPLELNEAVASFATGEVRSVDLAIADGIVFVHQFSVGLHAELIRLRERRTYASRLGKIWASCRAGIDAFIRPPRFAATLLIDGEEVMVKTSAIGITNNVFGEGRMLPYADTLTDGVLGVYVTRARRRRDMVATALRLALGRWRDNPHIDLYKAREVKVTLSSKHGKLGCAIDGELVPLAKETTLRVLPAALRVLVPRPL